MKNRIPLFYRQKTGDIMQAVITDIKRFAVHDGDGIRTTVFFKGCPLSCVWCHNPECIDSSTQIAYFMHKCANCGECSAICDSNIMVDGNHVFDRNTCINCGNCISRCKMDAFRQYGKTVSVQEVLQAVLEDRLFYETGGGGVTLSGGECLLQAEFCAEVLKILKKEGINTAVDTCGFVPQAAFEQVAPFTDVFLYDIKAIDEKVHVRCTGQSNRIILDNLRYLEKLKKKVEIRIPFVPDWNDGEMEKITRFLEDFSCVTRVKVLPYHSFAESKYVALGMKNTLPKTLPDDLQIKKVKSFFDKWN